MGLITDFIESVKSDDGVGYFEFKKLHPKTVTIIQSTDDIQLHYWYKNQKLPWQFLMLMRNGGLCVLDSIPKRGMNLYNYIKKLSEYSFRRDVIKKERERAFCLLYDALSELLVNPSP